jgi:hypothetical protein
MPVRSARAGKNEALFRDVNERIRALSEQLALDAAQAEILDGLVCECADPACIERLGQITVAEYESVRRDAIEFIVAPGHVDPEIESVVKRRPGYWLVRKYKDAAADVARASDPRR